MNKKAMLSVDLNNVTSKQRDNFYKKLKELQWNKLNRLTTIWKVSFESGVTETTVISTTKSDVNKAAADAKITDYEAVVHVGNSDPTEF